VHIALLYVTATEQLGLSMSATPVTAEFLRVYSRMVSELAVCGVDRNHCEAGPEAFQRLAALAPRPLDYTVCLTSDGLSFEDIMNTLLEEDRPHFRRHYLYLLALLRLADLGDLTRLEQLQGAFREARRSKGPAPQDVDAELSRILEAYRNTREVVATKATCVPPPPAIPQLPLGGVLGDLAREISGEIVQEIPEAEQGDFDTAELLGRVMQKVTGKIGTRIRSGQLKQDQLFQEAMGMLGSLAAGGMNLGGGADTAGLSPETLIGMFGSLQTHNGVNN
jgi:hypothetical protein